MKQTTYPLDNSGIIHLATLRPGHSNLFRISATLREAVRPELEPIFIRRLCEMGCAPTLEVDGAPTDLGRFLRSAGGRTPGRYGAIKAV